MCFWLACKGEERAIGSEKAPGSCPFCAGAVIASDVEVTWKLLYCLPISLISKRRFQCSRCSKHLVTTIP